MLSGDHGASCVWRRFPICVKAEKFPFDDLWNNSRFCPPAAHPGTWGSSRDLSGPFASPGPQAGQEPGTAHPDSPEAQRHVPLRGAA